MASLSFYLKADTWRIHKKFSIRYFLYSFLRYPAFRVIVTYRLCRHLQAKAGLWGILYPVARFAHRYSQYSMGLEIPVTANIGPGLLIHHGWSTVLNDSVTLGANVTLLHSVTIGGTKDGAPTIGDRVTIAAGAIVIGPVTIGDDVVIGAGSVVTKDVPSGSVVAGNPAKVLSKSHNRFPINCFSEL